MAQVVIGNTHWGPIRIQIDEPPFTQEEIPGTRSSNSDGTSTERKYGWKAIDKGFWKRWCETHADQDMLVNKVLFEVPDREARILLTRGTSSATANPRVMPFQSGRPR